MSKQLKEIQHILREHAAAGNHDFFKKMIPGEQKIYGVKTPILNTIVKSYKNGSFELVEELWQAGSLEERMIAIKIVERIGKTNPSRVLSLFKKFSRDIDNWAVCDGMGMQFLRGMVLSHADEIIALAKKYNKSKNFWERRLSLVMVEWYTRKKEHIPVIQELMKTLEKDDEYYVKKAVTWIKKNLAKGK